MPNSLSFRESVTEEFVKRSARFKERSEDVQANVFRRVLEGKFSQSSETDQNSPIEISPIAPSKLRYCYRLAPLLSIISIAFHLSQIPWRISPPNLDEN